MSIILARNIITSFLILLHALSQLVRLAAWGGVEEGGRGRRAGMPMPLPRLMTYRSWDGIASARLSRYDSRICKNIPALNEHRLALLPLLYLLKTLHNSII